MNLKNTELRTVDLPEEPEVVPKKRGRPRKERNPRGRPRKHVDPKEALKASIRKYQAAHPFKMILNNIKRKCFKLNLPFDLTEESIKPPKFCPILGLELTSVKGRGLLPNATSIDRIDPDKGYTEDNIQIISLQANRMKQNASPEELIAFADWVYAKYKK